ncbi:MAG: bifunctional ADP-dependent NAD(P)H-hydrate dehydratase/NAD(P)H-hydrate epimerase [Ilumatobacter sp.]
MIPVVTPEEMRAIDAAASAPLDELVRRAGFHVAHHAIDLLGGSYGRRAVVLAGGGNNGRDGRDAADRLERRGVGVTVFEAGELPERLPPCDVVIDAAYGTGFRVDERRPWAPPAVPDGAAVLAVDIPSGVDGLTGRAVAGALRADRTITFQALKPGLLFADGPVLAGDVRVADIGLDTSHIACHLVESVDVARWWPRRERSAHKWHGAVKVIAGSDAMPGAAELCTAAAMRAGSGLVSLSAPGCRPSTRSEVVQRQIPTGEFADDALSDIGRFGALVIGPGLGRRDETLLAARECIEKAPLPVVIDGDGIFAASWSAEGAEPLLAARELPTVVTPHDGEFGVLTGQGPADDRIAAARGAAARFDATVLLKGPTTVIAAPPARRDRSLVDLASVASPDDLSWASDRPSPVLLVDVGDQRLATAGSGDVLSGLLGAVLAADVDPTLGAAAAAWVHGDCARRGPELGLVAGDLVDLLPEALSELAGGPESS